MKLLKLNEINLLEEYPIKKNKYDKTKYNDFLNENENNLNLNEKIKKIRNIVKTWYIYEKLHSDILNWSNSDFKWVEDIKKELLENKEILNINIEEFSKFIENKIFLERENKPTTTPMQEIKCSELIFERGDDYEIIF